MKTKLVSIIALFAIIAIGIIACNNGDNNNTTHVHDWNDWTVTTPATCTSAGEETRICKLDASHTDTQPIAALGHDWDEWRVTKDPTTTTEGVETRTCKRDATHKETRAIAKLPDPTIPRDQTATISLFGGSHTATVKGTMTNAEWNGVADKIADELNELEQDDDIDEIKEIFSRGVTYIVESNPKGYTNYKTIGDGKTIYLNLSKVDSLYVIQGVISIYRNGSEIDSVEQPKDQTATITLFGGSHTATVKGTMTDTEWNGVANKIEKYLNDFVDDNPMAKDPYKELFSSRDITYIVEPNPDGYTNFKTIGDGKTIYIALSKVDTGYIIDGIMSIYSNVSTIGKVMPKAIQPKHNRVHAG
ncbi:MAG: hypothetical protein LBC52_03415 [Treponema sp.]|jgi:hypothetical protein|nr:hypothetical protein [Treponema sp.]